MEPDPGYSGVGNTFARLVTARLATRSGHFLQAEFSVHTRFVTMVVIPLPVRFLFFSFAIATATAAGAFGQERLAGRVTSDAGPLAGASVVLVDESSGQERYASSTAADGSFNLGRVSPGRYLLAASHVGFVRFTRRISVPVTDRLSIRLEQSTVSQPEVVITGLRAEISASPVTATNLTSERLEELPVMRDLPGQLALLPSTISYSENGNGIGYGTLRLRGFDQRRVAVAINGIPQNDPEDFNVFWINFFDLQSTVDDIQVQRGAGGAFYGSTGIGGAINIVSRPYRAQPFVRIEAGAGTFATRRYAAAVNSGLVGGRYVFHARASRLLSDGYRDWSWSRFWRFFAGVTRYGPRSTITLQAFGGPQEDGLAFSGVAKSANDNDDARRANFSGFTRDTESFHQPHVELTHSAELTARVSFSQSVFYVAGKGYFDFGGTFRSAGYLMLPEGFVSDDQRSLPLFISRPDVSVLFRANLDQWQIGWQPRLIVLSAGGRATVGGELRLHRSERWGRIQEAAGIPPELVGSVADRRVYQFRGEKVIASAFASVERRLANRILAQGDIQLTSRRYRVFDEAFFGNAFTVPYVFINPRFGITVDPGRPVSAYASVSVASREPRLKTLYDGEEAGAGFVPRFAVDEDGVILTDRAEVKPERVHNVELGAIAKSSRARIHVTTYIMDFRDEIVPSGGLDQFGVSRTGNADRSRHVGVEADGAVSLHRFAELSGNVNFSRNRFLRFTEFVSSGHGETSAVSRAGNPIAGFPGRTGAVGVRFRKGPVTLSTDLKMVDRQYVDNSGGRDETGQRVPDLEVDAYALFDISVRVAPPLRGDSHAIEVSLDIQNVTNNRVLQFGNVGPAGPQFFPSATRQAFARIVYTLR